MGEQEFKFEEGLTYSFVVTGLIQMPPDDEEFFVLRSRQNSRHLLSKNLYAAYGISPGMEITCKVDKVNCSGKMFLEPEHPHYKTGGVYDFNVIRTISITNSVGNVEKMTVVSDIAGNEIFVPYSELPDGGEQTRLSCRVERIKKGLLFLSHYQGETPPSQLEQGKTYRFEIKGIVTLARHLEYYKLECMGETHYLRTRYYEAYAFPAQSEVYCEVVEPTVPYTHYLEPVHPFYKAGEVYEFENTGRSIISHDLGEVYHVLMLKDKIGHSYPVPCRNKDITAGNYVRCRVEKIRMSKVYLECLE